MALKKSIVTPILEKPNLDADDLANYLLRRSDATYGIRNGALMWIPSYLSDRTEKVHVSGYISPYVPLKYGVPQGLVLGPLLFIMYTGKREHIINSHGLLSYCYADYQLSFFCNPGETESLATRVINCVDVSNWMSSNRLKVNPKRLNSCGQRLADANISFHMVQLLFSQVDIIPLCCVKLLGIYIHDDISASTQINKVVSSDFIYLQHIKSIRRCLPTDAAKSLVNAFVISRLDYCNSLYANLPQAQLDRIQSVFNGTARLIFGASRFSHVTPLLCVRLH